MERSKSSGITAVQRRALTTNFRSHEEYNRRYCAGSAMVFSSVVQRTMLTALFWIQRPAHPTKVLANLPDALEWANSRVKALQRGERPEPTDGTSPHQALPATSSLPPTLAADETVRDVVVSRPGHRWILQFGEPGDRDQASKLADALAAAGYVPAVERVEEGAETRWVARLRYPTHGEAAMSRGPIEARGFAPTLLSEEKGVARPPTK
jgi:hypothetical protein